MTTILINDIKQDYKHIDFISVEGAGLGYTTEPYIGANLGDAKPENMTDHEWFLACDRYEKYLKAHQHELCINPAGYGW